MDTRFHCVYLLTSLDPQCAGDYYIGYTVNPLRRLRQHNGEIVNGARRTSRRGRPWTIVCCVSGFTEDRAALKFEWCWQHPTASARLKHTLAASAAALRGLHRLPYAVAMLHFLLHADLFNRLDLTLHVFEQELFSSAVATATAGRGTATLPALTESALFHVEFISRETFQQRYLGGDASSSTSAVLLEVSGICPCADQSALSETVLRELGEEEEEWPFADGSDRAEVAARLAAQEALLARGLLPCSLCGLPLRPPMLLCCPCAPLCELRAHPVCLGLWVQYRHHTAARGGAVGAAPSPALLVPSRPTPCPLCNRTLQWGSLVKDLKRRTAIGARARTQQRHAKMDQRIESRLREVRDHRFQEQQRQGIGKRRRRCSPSPSPPPPPSLLHQAQAASPPRIAVCQRDDDAGPPHWSSKTAMKLIGEEPSNGSLSTAVTAATSTPVLLASAPPQPTLQQIQQQNFPLPCETSNILTLTQFNEGDWI